MKRSVLSPHIYTQQADSVAFHLLGRRLVRYTSEGVIAGLITETEAYLPDGDPANHASRGETPRNASMFLAGGHWYVYLVYGMHYCLNLVTGREQSGEAVLIRGVAPTHGHEHIRANRPGVAPRNLTNGPAKLTKAFAIDTRWDGTFLADSSLTITETDTHPPNEEIDTTGRVGISEARDRFLRYVWVESP